MSLFYCMLVSEPGKLIWLSIIQVWKIIPNTKLICLSIIRAWKTIPKNSNSKNITCCNYSGVEDQPRKVQFQNYHMFSSICYFSVQVLKNINIHLSLQCTGVSKYQHPSVTLYAQLLQNINIPNSYLLCLSTCTINAAKGA